MTLNLIKVYSNLLEIQSLGTKQRTTSLKSIFKRDIEDNTNFKYAGKPIYPVKKHGYPTMETLFNHLITKEEEGSKTKSRIFDIHRSQRLHWIKHHINNNGNINIFSHTDRIRGKDTIRTYLFDEGQKYIIILEPRTEGVDLYYLITAYYLDQKYGEKQIKKKMKNKLPYIY